MTTTDLRAKITETGFLVMDCPICKDHKIRIPLSPAVDRWNQSWAHSGELDKITLQPSINAGCAHFNVVDGNIVMAV